jgi:hypothetical protein
VEHRFPITDGDDSLSICSYVDGLSLDFLGLGVAVDQAGSGDYEVGVSLRDREARALAFGEDYDRLSELKRTISEVKARRVHRSTHPLAQAAPERWLRHRIMKNVESGDTEVASVELGSLHEARRRAYAVVGDRLVVATVGPDLGAVFELGAVYRKLQSSGYNLDGGATIVMSGRDRVAGLESVLAQSLISVEISVTEAGTLIDEIVSGE